MSEFNSNSNDTLSPGTMLGQYRVVKLLGRGGMGEVYEVEHQVLDKRFALKVLPPSLEWQVSLERFRREARVMANLEHPNIVRVDEFGETEGRYWLRMELVATQAPQMENGKSEEMGEISTLAELAELRGGQMKAEELAKILKGICEGLVYAHSRGAIHRDLKPANILLGKEEGEWVPKISDFGLVSLVGEEWINSQVQLSVQQSLSMGEQPTQHESGSGSGGSRTKSLLGTFEYMSPEQKRGEEVDVRTDIYALGMMSFRLLTGKNPGLKRPSELKKGLDKGWDLLLVEALEEDREDRIATVELFLERLDKLWSPTLEQKVNTPTQNLTRVKTKKLPRPTSSPHSTPTGSRIKHSGKATKSSKPTRQKPTAKRKGSRVKTVVALLLLAGLGAGGYFYGWPAYQETLRLKWAPDLVEVTEAIPAPLTWLALGSREAQERQLAQAEELNLPLEVKTAKLGMHFRLVPSGLFTMGSPADEVGRDDDEEEQVNVTLTKAFYVGKYEVTQGEWQRVMGENPSRFENAGKDAPVDNMSWEECQEFLEKFCEQEGVPRGTYRLLTEAEWEYACRAGTQSTLYTGRQTIRGENNSPELDEIAWYGGNSGVNYKDGEDSSGWNEKQYDHNSAGPHVVGEKKGNAYGLHDMIGNVWEWTGSWFGEYPETAPVNYAGPASGSYRVLRGGSWSPFPGNCRSAARRRGAPDYHRLHLGLRLMRAVPPPVE